MWHARAGVEANTEMDRAIACLLADRPGHPQDATDWPRVLESAAGRRGGGAASAYFGAAARRKQSAADAIARARAGLGVLGGGGAGAQWLAVVVAAEGGGRKKLACSGPRAFARVLLAWVAAEALDSVHRAAAAVRVDASTARALLADAEAAAAAVRAALPWSHGESVRPAQLGPRFQARARALVHLLQYAALPQRAPDTTMAAAQSQRAVALLQLVVADTRADFKQACAWAESSLRVETAHAWAIHRADPRPGAPPAAPVQDVVLYAAIRGICSKLQAADVPRSAKVAVAALEAIVGARTAEVDAQMAAVGDAANMVAPLDLPSAAKMHSRMAATTAAAAAQTPEAALETCAPAPPPVAW